MADTEIIGFQGDTIEGSVSLRETDPCDPELENTYVIPSGSTIEMRFPGTSGVVSITSGASEITNIVNAKGTFDFKIPLAKSALLKAEKKQTVYTLVTYNAGADRKAFKKEKIFTVETVIS